VDPEGFPLHVFPPLAEIPLPIDGGHRLALPSPLAVADHFERHRFAEVVLGTPGPLGLLALAAAKLLGVGVTAVCQTDLPRDARRLAGSVRLEDLARSFTGWFYGQADRVLAPGEANREALIAAGVPARAITLLPGPDGLADALWPARPAAADRRQAPAARPFTPEPVALAAGG
jgi:hypothetical protein